MIKFFQKLFEEYNLSDADISKYANDFAAVVVFTLIGAAEKHLIDDDRKTIQKYMKEKKFDKIMPIIENKYSPEEWENILDQQVKPLFESYIKEVINN